MRLNVALVGLCALLLVSACARDSETTEETQAAANDTQGVADDAHAAEDPQAESTPTEPCDDAPDQRAMTACWGNESRKHEALVEAALKKLDAIIVARSMPSGQQQLQEDQQRWQAFVEGHCGLYGALYDGGSAGPMTVAVCRWQLAQSRLQQITDLTEELDR